MCCGVVGGVWLVVFGVGLGVGGGVVIVLVGCVVGVGVFGWLFSRKLIFL